MQFCHRCDCQLPDDSERCLHCGGPLHAHARGDTGGDADEEDSLPTLDAGREDLAHLASLTPHEAPRLLDRLAEAGVPFAIVDDDALRARDPRRAAAQRTRVHVLVAQEDLSRASRIEQEAILESLPDLPEGFDPHAHEEGSCPACGSVLASDSIECAECGLAFPEAER